MAAPFIDMNYVQAESLNSILLDVIESCEEARNASKASMFEYHLKMASRALRCALEIHGDWLTQEVRKEGAHEHVHHNNET